jgi:hypothetical protein
MGSGKSRGYAGQAEIQVNTILFHKHTILNFRSPGWNLTTAHKTFQGKATHISPQFRLVPKQNPKGEAHTCVLIHQQHDGLEYVTSAELLSLLILARNLFDGDNSREFCTGSPLPSHHRSSANANTSNRLGPSQSVAIEFVVFLHTFHRLMSSTFSTRQFTILCLKIRNLICRIWGLTFIRPDSTQLSIGTSSSSWGSF